jgi:hypothetical protein
MQCKKFYCAATSFVRCLQHASAASCLCAQRSFDVFEFVACFFMLVCSRASRLVGSALSSYFDEIDMRDEFRFFYF